jgi:hypothetical protein
MSKPLSVFALTFLLLLGIVTTGCSENRAETAPSGVPEGWKRFSDNRIELWLPPSFGGGEPTKGDLDLVLENFRRIGRDDLVRTAEEVRGTVTLLMLDNESANLGTSVTGGSASVPSGLTLEPFARSILQAFPPGFIVHEQRTVAIAGNDAIKVTLEFNAGQGLVVKQFLFLLKSGNTAAAVSYGTVLANFDRLASVFDQSAQTIRLRD